MQKSTQKIVLALFSLVLFAFSSTVRAEDSAGDLMGPPEPPAATPVAAATPASLPTEVTEAQRVRVQHILIAFDGSLPETPIPRNQEEAGKLAQELLERAKGGENFDELVREYTNDEFPGIYGITNRGAPPASGYYPREGLVAGFGDVAFGLQVGEIGLVPYAPENRRSPYGWHILKRLD